MGTFAMQDVYNITGIGLVIVGKVEGDIIRIGMKARTGGNVIEVKTIEMHHQQIAEANPGDAVGMAVTVIGVDVASGQANTSFWKKLFSASGSKEQSFLRSLVGKRLIFN
jgi:translation elongation factor EF-1alpha